MASTYLSRTNTSPTSAYRCTFSGWVKRSKLGSRQRLMTVINPSSTGAYYFVEFTSGDNLGVNDYDGVSAGGIGGSTARKFRDTNAWYHIVVAYDTTQATGTDRIKVYVNGVEDTFNFDATGDQNRTLSASVSGKTQFIGYHGTSSMYWDGSMSHVHFVDGIAYNGDTFGETDSTTGIWEPKTAPSVTYGNNGFFLKFENSGAFGTDSSGNSNTFSVNGTMTQLIDTPSNVFATLNPLDGGLGDSEFTYGNNRFYSNTGSNVVFARSTLGFTSGKYYAEMKCETASSHNYLGIGNRGCPSTSTYFGDGTYEYGYKSSTGQSKNAGNLTSYGNTWTTNDIIGIAVDLDNNKLYFSKNGVWQNSGDPTSGATGTGAISIASASTIIGSYGGDDAYFIVAADGTSSNAGRYQMNFGNGYFGTTAVSSAQNPDDGIGIFEYDVPAGYRALCTKSINAEEYS